MMKESIKKILELIDFETLVNNPDIEVRKAVAEIGINKYLDVLVNDDSAEVRKAVAEIGINKYLDVLVNDDSAEVRKAVAMRYIPKYCKMLIDDEDSDIQKLVTNYIKIYKSLKAISTEDIDIASNIIKESLKHISNDSKKQNQKTKHVVLERNILENEVIENRYEIYDINKIENTMVQLNMYPEHIFRARSEVLILDDTKTKVFISLKNKEGFAGKYKLPGGGWDKDESPIDAVIRESREEVMINIKNPKYYGSYVTILDKPKQSVVDTITNPDERWKSYYTKVYVAEYDSKYTGHVDELDKNEIINTGKFYDISEVYDRLHDIHKCALKRYIEEIA